MVGARNGTRADSASAVARSGHHTDRTTADGCQERRGRELERRQDQTPTLIPRFQAAKEGWLKEIARHRNLSGADYAVAIMLSTYLNSRTYEAWPSLHTLATDTNRNRSTVWRSIKRLERLNLLQVTRAPGRSRSNRYKPLLGDLDAEPQKKKRLPTRNKTVAGSQQSGCELAY
jgi:predicted transcriptional regulator